MPKLSRRLRIVAVEYVLRRTVHGWKISDIRYDDGYSLKKILQSPL